MMSKYIYIEVQECRNIKRIKKKTDDIGRD